MTLKRSNKVWSSSSHNAVVNQTLENNIISLAVEGYPLINHRAEVEKSLATIANSTAVIANILGTQFQTGMGQARRFVSPYLSVGRKTAELENNTMMGASCAVGPFSAVSTS